MKTNRNEFIIAVSWFLIITILLCLPGSRIPKLQWDERFMLDKWVHLFLFLVLVLLWCRAHLVKSKKNFLAIAVISAFYGVIMEMVQHYFIPYRSFDYRDMIANCLGAAIGYLISLKKLLANR